jgi:uncharacterized protein YraI
MAGVTTGATVSGWVSGRVTAGGLGGAEVSTSPWTAADGVPFVASSPAAQPVAPSSSAPKPARQRDVEIKDLRRTVDLPGYGLTS